MTQLTPLPFSSMAAIVVAPPSADAIELEDASGNIQLESGEGVIQLET